MLLALAVLVAGMSLYAADAASALDDGGPKHCPVGEEGCLQPPPPPPTLPPPPDLPPPPPAPLPEEPKEDTEDSGGTTGPVPGSPDGAGSGTNSQGGLGGGTSEDDLEIDVDGDGVPDLIIGADGKIRRPFFGGGEGQTPAEVGDLDFNPFEPSEDRGSLDGLQSELDDLGLGWVLDGCEGGGLPTSWTPQPYSAQGVGMAGDGLLSTAPPELLRTTDRVRS